MPDLTTLLSKFLVQLYSGAAGTLTASQAGIGTTSTDGFIATNPTLSTSGATVQMSPSVNWLAHVWNTASDETSEWGIENLPASAATPTSLLNFTYSRNGGAATIPASFSNLGALTLLGALNTPSSASAIFYGTRGSTGATATGVFQFQNNATTAGSILKVDALPTIASGFGTSPFIVAGSTPFAGAVNVGTGGTAVGGVVNFNGTAFPSIPFCVASGRATNGVTRLTPSTTQLNFDINVAWNAGDTLSWICVSAK